MKLKKTESEKKKNKMIAAKKRKMYSRKNVDTVIKILRTAHNTLCKIEMIEGKRLKIIPLLNIWVLEFILNRYETIEFLNRKEVIYISKNYIKIALEQHTNSTTITHK